MFDIKIFSNTFYSKLKNELKFSEKETYNENYVFSNAINGALTITTAPLILTIATVSNLAQATFKLMKGQSSVSAKNLQTLKTRICEFSIKLIAGLGLLIPYVNKVFIQHVRNYKPYS